MKKYFIAFSLCTLFLFFPKYVAAHCEIPCGIYDDNLRVEMLKEHVATIEKSMNEIVRLQKSEVKDYNQLVRWINNKDKHADDFQYIVQQYFMNQRIKPVDSQDKAAYLRYTNELVLLHKMLVYSMKAKQTVDLDHVDTLKSLITEFQSSYFHVESEEPPPHKH